MVAAHNYTPTNTTAHWYNFVSIVQFFVYQFTGIMYQIVNGERGKQRLTRRG